MAKTFLLTAVSLMLAAHGVQAQEKIRAVITADNAYSFGYGSATSIPQKQFYGGVENMEAADIFACGRGPETYDITPLSTEYLYIITWSDDMTTQGVLGQFRNTNSTSFGQLTPPIYTGTSDWEVYATGIDFDIPSGGPSRELINQQIALANVPPAGPNSSGGWVGVSGGTGGNLVIGEANTNPRSATSPFPYVCGISPAARWMWYNARPGVLNGFTDGLPGYIGHREFLIFRIPARKLVERNPVETFPGAGRTGLTIDPGLTITRQCGLDGEVSRVCALGSDSQGNVTYAFAVPLSLSNTESCELSLKNMPPWAVGVSYGPTTLSSGTTQVSGTFTVPPTATGPVCFELQCRSGETNSCSKRVCATLPPRPMPAHGAHPQDTTTHDRQPRVSRFEVGGHFTSLNTRLNSTTEPGVGGRLTYNALDSLAFEAEANFFPRDGFATEIGGGQVSQLFVGLKSGWRFDSFGLFGIIRPGVQSFTNTVIGYHRERESFGGFAFEPDVGRKNLFALNFGGGVELYPASRVGFRFDLGDTITFHPSRTGLNVQGLVRRPRFTEQNVQVSSGLVYRF